MSLGVRFGASRLDTKDWIEGYYGAWDVEVQGGDLAESERKYFILEVDKSEEDEWIEIDRSTLVVIFDGAVGLPMEEE